MHNPDLISESPMPLGDHTYTARRSAEPESNGSWRWEVFVDAPRMPQLVGYIQSHDCPDTGTVRLLVFDNNGRQPAARGRFDHLCSASHAMALLWFDDVRVARSNRAAAEALPAMVVNFDED
jgi:hypothetical protein